MQHDVPAATPRPLKAAAATADENTSPQSPLNMSHLQDLKSHLSRWESRLQKWSSSLDRKAREVEARKAKANAFIKEKEAYVKRKYAELREYARDAKTRKEQVKKDEEDVKERLAALEAREKTIAGRLAAVEAREKAVGKREKRFADIETKEAAALETAELKQLRVHLDQREQELNAKDDELAMCLKSFRADMGAREKNQKEQNERLRVWEQELTTLQDDLRVRQEMIAAREEEMNNKDRHLRTYLTAFEQPSMIQTPSRLAAANESSIVLSPAESSIRGSDSVRGTPMERMPRRKDVPPSPLLSLGGLGVDLNMTEGWNDVEE